MNEEINTEAQNEQKTGTTAISMEYAGANNITGEKDSTKIHLFGNLYRDPVNLDARILSPLEFRQGMAALYNVVSSDYRYVPKDRSAYLAYMQLKRTSANMNTWKARQEYFSWLARNDPGAWLILDPIVSVHPDRIMFEVFSKDEGSYAALSMDTAAFEIKEKPAYGTTNIDFTKELADGFSRMRSTHNTVLAINHEAVTLARQEPGKEPDTVLEKKINVPDSWLRGFLQVQTSATLAHDCFKMAPIDLYNLLRHLRLNADIKRKPRGLRIELVPGQYPRMVLEPWETLIQTETEIYKGRQAKVVRIWGRRRLMMLKQFLPFAREIEVNITGSGLPSFWILRADSMSFTLGLTGFTAADWSRALNFDLLLPRTLHDTKDTEKILAYLSDKWFDKAENISKAVNLKAEALSKSLQTGCQQGSLMYDIEKNVFRLRPLTTEALSMAQLEFRNGNERFAHDLINRKNAVKIESENRILGTGLELTGKVAVEEDRREYRPLMLINEEGQVQKAECTCTFFRKQGIKQGPCPHLIALRFSHAQQAEKDMRNQAARKRILLETRTYSKRSPKGENMFQLTLDRHMLKIRWGIRGRDIRAQNLRFNTSDQAREAYFERTEELTAQGYLDATA